MEGRVELFTFGRWTSICGNAWGINEATVACRQLNLGKAGNPIRNAHFGGGEGDIFFQNVKCRGNESSLQHCDSDNGSSVTCTHDLDVAVRCSGYLFAFFL